MHPLSFRLVAIDDGDDDDGSDGHLDGVGVGGHLAYTLPHIFARLYADDQYLLLMAFSMASWHSVKFEAYMYAATKKQTNLHLGNRLTLIYSIKT